MEKSVSITVKFLSLNIFDFTKFAYSLLTLKPLFTIMRRLSFLLLVFLTGFGLSMAQVTVSGVVCENGGKKKLPGVSLSVEGSNIGTVSNADGAFSLRIPAEFASGRIVAEQLGYFTRTISADSVLALNGKCIIRLEPTGRLLGEVVVRGGKPAEIVEQALSRIPRNYSPNRNRFSAFYRETIQKGRRYTSVSEAIVDVIKEPYDRRDIYGERVQIRKGRKILSQNSKDTLSVKLVGGPMLPVALDFVKNVDALFDVDFLTLYSFKMENPVSLDDRLHYVIRFFPKAVVSYPLNSGLLYIDQESLAFTKAEFEMDMSDKPKVIHALLRKKPRGLRFKPREMSYVVTYRLVDGVSYINYIRASSRFNCDWKRRLFSSGYTTNAEMVMVDRVENPQEGISRKSSFRSGDIFDDKVARYWDDNFWLDYNIIEPTESLEKAVGKLLKKKARIVSAL